MSGIGEEMGDVGLAIQRAEDKTAQMQARAGAIDELIASGALDDVSALGRGDDIARELDALELRGPTSRPSWPGSRPAARRPQAIEAAEDGGDILEPPSRSRGREHESGRVMIVRILGEGQYDVSDDALDRLNELDADGRGGGRGPATRRVPPPRSRRLLDGVRTVGVAHDADSLDESDLILPPPDATIDEVRELLSDDGLIPG